MSRSSLIAAVTFASITCSAVISIVWFAQASGIGHFEPAVGVLGLLAGITGVLAERRASARERRKLVLTSLCAELRSSVSVLTDRQFTVSDGDRPRGRVYRRLPTSATDSALTSGGLAERGDGELLRRLHEWRDAANGFNRRLDLTELRIFLTNKPDEIRQFEQILNENDGYVDRLRLQLASLRKLLATDKMLSPPQEEPVEAEPDRRAASEAAG